MKQHNIIALCLGIFAAALLWQYYLWPKYQLKQETPEVIFLIEESAQKELEESVNSGEAGEVLFIGDNFTTEISGSPKKEENLVFYSRANKPKDLFEQMSKDETKKLKTINVDDEDSVLNPSSLENVEHGIITQEDNSRITMLQLPSEFKVIKDEKSYEEFLKGNEGLYPKVNFKEEEIVVVISAGKFSDTFFEIVKAEPLEDEVKIFYRVNLMNRKEGNLQKNYKLIKSTNLPIKFIQVK